MVAGMIVLSLCVIGLIAAVGCLYIDIRNIKNDAKDTLSRTKGSLNYYDSQIDRLYNQTKELYEVKADKPKPVIHMSIQQAEESLSKRMNNPVVITLTEPTYGDCKEVFSEKKEK